jgi:cell division protein FtsB
MNILEEEKMNNKFSIGVVIAIVLQVSAFVWWTAQQAQTIDTLKNEVSELTAKAEIEKQVQLASEVKQLRKEIDKMKEDIIESLTSIDDARISEDNRLGNHIDVRIDSLIADLQAEFAKHEGWINELDVDVEDLYIYIADELQKLDKKLSDRITKGE